MLHKGAPHCGMMIALGFFGVWLGLRGGCIALCCIALR